MAIIAFAAPREDFQHYHGIAGPMARTHLGAPPNPATVHGFARVMSVRGGDSAVVNSHYTFPFVVEGDEREPLTLTCKAWLSVPGKLSAGAGRYDRTQPYSKANSLMSWADAALRANVQVFEMPARREITRLDLHSGRLSCATRDDSYLDTDAPLLTRRKQSQAQVAAGHRYELTIYVDMVVSTHSFNADQTQFPNLEDPEATSRLDFDNPQQRGIFASLALG